MRKKILLLCSLFILLCSFVLINRLQKSNFNVFNTVSSDEAQMLQNQLERKDELSFTALLCNDIRVPFDDTSSAFYVPLNMETESWEKLALDELQSAKVIDTYEKDGVKSMTVRLVFAAMDRTLEMEQVQGWIDTILSNLAEIGVTLRA